MDEATATGILFSRVDGGDGARTGVESTGASAFDPRWDDPKMAFRREDETFRAVRVLAFLLGFYLVGQCLGLLLGNDDHYVDPGTMSVSIASVAVLAGLLFTLDAFHRRRRKADPDRSSYNLMLASIAGLLVASLIQVHLMGSMNSFHLLLVLAILLCVSWLLEARHIALFFVAANLALAAIVWAEFRGVVSYAPLFSRSADLGPFFLDWRMVFGTFVNYVLVLAAATVLTLRLRRAFRRRSAEQQALIAQLNESLSHIRTLESLLPICSRCKKIRNDQGHWDEVEHYLSQRIDVRFTHGFCPACEKAMKEEFEQYKR